MSEPSGVTSEHYLPIHYVPQYATATNDGRWSPQTIFNIIGEPGTYITPVPQLYIVAEDQNHNDSAVAALELVLASISELHDLVVELQYYPYGNSVPFTSRINHAKPGSQPQKLYIELITAKVIAHIKNTIGMQPLEAILNGMHLDVTAADIDPNLPMDILAAAGTPPQFTKYYKTRDKQYDLKTIFTYVEVHQADGQVVRVPVVEPAIIAP